jgi:hypothetical protein
MPVALVDGFLQSNDLAHVPCLGMESHRLEDCIERVRRDRIKGIFGSPSFGFTGSNLDFLSNMSWVEAVWFWDVNLKSVDALYALQDLRFFGVHPKRPAIDFSRFGKLRRVVVEPQKKDRGLSELRHLELLNVWHYRPKEGDFSSLPLPPSLTQLQINWANTKSLESLPPLPNLRRLEVHRCRNLEYLGDVGAKYPKLEHFVVDACGRVPSDEGRRIVQAFAAPRIYSGN